MNHNASHAAPGAEPGVIGWAVSGIFHVSMILLLALVINDVPRGGTSVDSDSSGIVLEMKSAEGDAYEGENGSGEDANSVELISPPESIAARLDEPPQIDVSIESAPIEVAQPAI